MPQVPANVKKYAKAVVAIAGAVGAAASVIANGGDVVTVAVAVLTALGVYSVPNAK